MAAWSYVKALRGRGFGLGEFLEQLRLLLSRHADAGIATV
jgi:hypothetical protein